MASGLILKPICPALPLPVLNSSAIIIIDDFTADLIIGFMMKTVKRKGFSL